MALIAVRWLAAAVVAASLSVAAPSAGRAETPARPDVHDVLDTWYGLVLELVRHTPTYSPPVASRAFAYLGVAAYEAVASGSPELESLGGQLNGFSGVPDREAGAPYDDAVVVQAAIAEAARAFFANTGPTGQRALAMIGADMEAQVAAGVDPAVAERSVAYGRAVAAAILAWSADDGGAVVENMGFPLAYELKAGPAHWVPTSKIAQQQLPLLPAWGRNRPFAMPDGATCDLPPPPEYSENPDSPFMREVREVYDVSKALTPDQRAIARFWSDDPMLSPTPPGHWISIAMQTLDAEEADSERAVEVLARLGIGLADAFIGCWHTKFRYDYVRPVTVIRRLIDPKWESTMITPPFPEYPSGHSTQSGAAAVVLTAMFGDRPIRDATHEADGLPVREYPNAWAAAEEAGLSRLYGGIHFRSAVEQGLDQGRCIGAYAAALVTRR